MPAREPPECGKDRSLSASPQRDCIRSPAVTRAILPLRSATPVSSRTDATLRPVSGSSGGSIHWAASPSCTASAEANHRLTSAGSLPPSLATLHQAATSAPQRAKRGQIQRLDVQHRTQVPQQHGRHGTHVVQRPAAHACEPPTTAPLLAIPTDTYCTEIKWTPLNTQHAVSQRRGLPQQRFTDALVRAARRRHEHLCKRGTLRAKAAGASWYQTRWVESAQLTIRWSAGVVRQPPSSSFRRVRPRDDRRPELPRSARVVRVGHEAEQRRRAIDVDFDRAGYAGPIS